LKRSIWALFDAKQMGPVMKNMVKKFQKTMLAAAFAEAGEWDTAREMTPDLELLDRIFTAITFAEAGLHTYAIHCLNPAGRENRDFNSVLAENLGLQGVQLLYGTVSI
jgi:hypothetical protein